MLLPSGQSRTKQPLHAEYLAEHHYERPDKVARTPDDHGNHAEQNGFQSKVRIETHVPSLLPETLPQQVHRSAQIPTS